MSSERSSGDTHQMSDAGSRLSRSGERPKFDRTGSLSMFRKRRVERAATDPTAADRHLVQPIAVPTVVKERLASVRKKRFENDKSLTLSNLLSVTAVQRDFKATDAGVERPSQFTEPRSPERRYSRARAATMMTDAAQYAMALPLPVVAGITGVDISADGAAPRDPLEDSEAFQRSAFTCAPPALRPRPVAPSRDACHAACAVGDTRALVGARRPCSDPCA